MDEFSKYEKKNGKFINISKDFKSKLFETFMKNSEDKAGMGQFFTPLKIVREMVDMVVISNGMKICDPASGFFMLFLSLQLALMIGIGTFFQIIRGFFFFCDRYGIFISPEEQI